jgi:hypothetical protein
MISMCVTAGMLVNQRSMEVRKSGFRGCVQAEWVRRSDLMGLSVLSCADRHKTGRHRGSAPGVD